MSENSPRIRDFDKVVGSERKAKIGGEVVDVTRIPSRVTLEMAKLADDATKLNSEEGFWKSVDLVSKACLPSNPKITAEWLIDNTYFEQLMDFMDYVLEPVQKRTEEAEERMMQKAKNMTAQANKKPPKK